jgi:MFS transporter, PAT family, beta-lactamase induction signal transducer AmpG
VSIKLAESVFLKHGEALPALSENTFLRYFSFIVLYVAQGIPEGMTIFGIPAWMAMNGKTPAEIGGYVAVVMIPFSLKIFAAPLMERFTYLPMGRRRPWLLFGQLGLVLSFMGLSFVPDPLNNLVLLTMVVVCVHVFILFQDIATDSLVIDIVPIYQQAKANGFMWGAKTIGTSASLAIGSWLINHNGFSAAVLFLSVTVCLIMLVPLLLRERPGEKLLPWTAGNTSPVTARLKVDSWLKIFKSLKQVFLLPNGLLLMLSVFMIITALAFVRTLLPIFTIQSLEWTNEGYARIYATSNLVAGIIGMVTGGILIERFGKIRMLLGCLLLAGLLTAFMAFSKAYWHNIYFTTGYIAVFNLLFVFTIICLLAVAMQFCWRRISAVQFTFYMTVFNMGNAAGAALVGLLRNYFDWGYTILSFSVLIFLAMLVVPFLHVNKHLQQVDDLEHAYLENEKMRVTT